MLSHKSRSVSFVTSSHGRPQARDDAARMHTASVAMPSFPVLLAVLALLLSFRAAAAQNLPPVTLIASGGSEFINPVDAAPSPDGGITYFVATTPDGDPAVFAVATTGGDVWTVAAGRPLSRPRAVVVSTDADTVFVADSNAEARGMVFAISISDGAIRPLPGTIGLSPRALDLVREGGNEVLYFTGAEFTNVGSVTRSALYRLVLGIDDTATLLYQAEPGVLLDGVSVGANGDMYLAAAESHSGRVLRLANGNAEVLVPEVALGAPAGIALTKEGATLLVSAHSDTGSSQVVVVNLRDNSRSIFDEVIRANRSSGGLHRALDTEVFAWVDSTGGGGGRVYRVTVPRP